MNLLKTAILVILLSLLAGCSRAPSDRRLLQIDSSIAVSPEEAIVELDSIDPSTLREADRHFLDLLTVKAHDKAYLPHTSDSLILDVVDYYSGSPRSLLYTEALYYAGRVYSNLGDSPSALHYFQEALEAEPEGKGDAELRSRILSQTGRLLNTLRLYGEAIPYIKESMEISRNLNDTVGIIQDLQLLGSVYLRAKRLKEAESVFRKAISLNTHQDDELTAKSLLYIGAVKYKEDQLDSARLYLHDLADRVPPMVRNNVLAYSTETYYFSEMYDSAFFYAKALIKSQDDLNKESGYNIIMAPELRGRLHPDTLDNYIGDYLTLLESGYNEHGSRLAIQQQAAYNYNRHVREREKAERFNKVLTRWIIGISFLVLLMGFVILLLKLRRKNDVIRLHRALDQISKLEQSLEKAERDLSLNEKNKMYPTPHPSRSAISITDNPRDLRKEIQERLLKIYQDRKDDPVLIPSLILESKAYSTLQDYIFKAKALNETDHLWQDLEEVVSEVSPDFKENLHLLLGGKLSSYDLQISLLIKCGVSPKDMSCLLNKAKGTISSRRGSLCERIFDRNLGNKVIDEIIRLL